MIQASQCANGCCGKSTKGAVPGVVKSRFLLPLHREDPLALGIASLILATMRKKKGNLPREKGILTGDCVRLVTQQ
jgi:hypothetical protein